MLFFPISSVRATLIHLCNKSRHAIAYGSDCTLRLSTWYDEDEKKNTDYIGDGNVEIIGWEPYFENDVKVILSNKQFFGYLKKYVSEYEQKYPEEKDKIKHCLSLIQIRLDIET